MSVHGIRYTPLWLSVIEYMNSTHLLWAVDPLLIHFPCHRSPGRLKNEMSLKLIFHLLGLAILAIFKADFDLNSNFLRTISISKECNSDSW